MNETYLAFDLGAESGRAMLAELRAGVLDLREIRRFPNEPVWQNGSPGNAQIAMSPTRIACTGVRKVAGQSASWTVSRA